MSFVIGNDSYELSKNNKVFPIIWDPTKLANYHVGITGISGSGKTYQLKRFISGLPQSVSIDILDYHDDIDVIGSSGAIFSEQTKHGYNPFVINPDPHYGGVRKAANAVIDILSSSRKLGDQQLATLRNLIDDCFRQKWINANNPRSWIKKNATEQECTALYEARDWAGLRECFPTLVDLERMIQRKIKSSVLGLDDNNKAKDAVFALESFMKDAKKLKQTRTSVSEEQRAALEKAKEKAINSYISAMNSVEDGQEFEDVLRYSSVETLQSLLLRVQNVMALGLFSSNPPSFSGNIHRYRLKPMATSESELKMFVYSRLNAIYREEMQKGESEGKLRRFIVLDEAKKFCNDDSDNPINIIANEARKFGIGLLLASQSPTHFSKDFINSAGTLLVQNMASSDYNMAAQKLQLDKKKLEFLIPRKTGLLRMQESGKAARWKGINFN
ncbi:hypothetical protein ABLA30_13835 [Xenorhabdus nematophila]|uniref:hypothetical protein n=1 Tax=Xenorhabdus nematophila TaxID=628 RepID=UPI0032B741BC